MWNIKKLLLGQPLTTDRVSHERLSKKKALAVFSSDALSSVAYASEEILIVLSAAVTSTHALPFAFPISISIALLLAVLITSYRQTIKAYPHGGGAYIVCKENLGLNISLVAAAALIIDYILTVAVSIAAGAAAVTSAFPELIPHKVLISNFAIIILMFINLRGIRESATIFAIPTYLFIFGMISLFGLLGYKAIVSPVTHAPSLMPSTFEGVGLFLVLKAFSSGCAALTGVEAISNGVTAFKQPEQRNANVTLVWMGFILGFLFLGVSYFMYAYNITLKEHETVVSQLARQLDMPLFYYFIQASTALILFLAANTSFNAFPLVTSLLAEDRFLPRQLASRGDRLVYSNGIIGLGIISMFLIWAVQGEVHSLIPMYAIGVFLCFSLSQFGMVKHWLESKGKYWLRNLCINLLGGITTAIVLSVIVITKFVTPGSWGGGWVVVLIIPLMVAMFRRVKYHYLIVGNQLRLIGPAQPVPAIAGHHVVIPVSGIHRGVLEALNYARSISKDITACYIDISPRTTAHIVTDWEKYGMGVKLKILSSPYRSIIKPLLDFVEEQLQENPSGLITVIIPEFVTARWWQTLLHNQTAFVIRAALAFKRRVVVTSVRYHLAR